MTAVDTCELTILMPCLDEAETIETCVRKAREFLERAGLRGEVLVADNGSRDGSQSLAAAAGARVIAVPIRGYGAAITAGIESARGIYVIVGDADDSYDFSRLDPFLSALREGSDLVIGNRFQGGIARAAMPALHRYLGNPVLSFMGRLFFSIPIGDFHCGLRGLRREAFIALGLSATGMEFASEMIVKAKLAKLRISEVPTTLSRDGRSRAPHLRTWRDGWRHLRFLLLHSPDWLFFYPGVGIAGLGLLLMVLLLNGPLKVGMVRFDVHTLLYGMAAVQIGVQLVFFSIVARRYAMSSGMLPDTASQSRVLRWFSLEHCLLAGAALFIIGVALGAAAVHEWSQVGLQELDPSRTMRLVIPSVGMIILGGQLIVNAFLMALIAVEPRSQRTDAPATVPGDLHSGPLHGRSEL
ncbi:MAG: glycosyltransferase family 2 protein [Betaproteobacteria bacterium]